jgi:hypothetical protein
VEQAVEQERRRTEGEWRRIEDDLARMEEERLRERSGSVISTIFLFFYFSFLARNLRTFTTFWLARLYFSRKFRANTFVGFIIFVAF